MDAHYFRCEAKAMTYLSLLVEVSLVSLDTYTHFDGRKVTEPLIVAPIVTPEELDGVRWN